MTSQDWLVPTAMIGAAGLLVQGVKAGWDLWVSLSSARRSQQALRIQEASACLHFLDGLPLDHARRTLHKIDLLRRLHGGGSVESMYDIVDEATRESRGG